MMVKICGVTTVADALVAVDAGATAIGLNFYSKSPRYLDASKAKEITDKLPRTIVRVGVFVDEPAERVAAIAAGTGIDVVQLCGSSMATGLRVWRAWKVEPGFTADALNDPEAEAFLLDAAAPGLHGGTGKTFDWNAARGTGKRIILAGGLDASNVREAIETARPWGVDACSRLESAPGKKDPQKVRDFIKAALSI